MVSYMPKNGRLPAALLALTLSVAGCSVFHRDRTETPPEPTSAAISGSTQSAAPEAEQTATELAVSPAAPASNAEDAPSSASAAINPTAPRSYTVKRGDTLWGIASLFLRDPWLWPEIWIVNPQVPNPHLIYPGDVIGLAYGTDGRPQLILERGGDARLNPRLRSTPLDGAIPAIPYSAIAAFLSRPEVLTYDQVKRAPHIVAFRDKHLLGGAGHEVYVRGLNAKENARYSVIHVGDELRDPDDNRVVGYQGIYTATALVTAPGEPAKALLSDSARETLRGDELFASDTLAPLNFVPRAPKSPVKGRIISVVDGVELIGQYQIVVINRGTRHGLDIGNVLAVDAQGEVVRDARVTTREGLIPSASFLAPRVKLPDERAGTLLVFKTFDRISYALVVGASSPMRVRDVVRNP